MVTKIGSSKSIIEEAPIQFSHLNLIEINKLTTGSLQCGLQSIIY